MSDAWWILIVVFRTRGRNIHQAGGELIRRRRGLEGLLNGLPLLPHKQDQPAPADQP